MQQWLCGFFLPAHAYHGENTEPMKPMIEIAFSPSYDSPSTYHHAYPFEGTFRLKFGLSLSLRPRAFRKAVPLECPVPDVRPRPLGKVLEFLFELEVS